MNAKLTKLFGFGMQILIDVLLHLSLNPLLVSMRVVGEIPHPYLKITIFNWNNRYLIKLEHGSYEQTFKVSELDVTSEEDLIKLVDTEFLKESEARFHDMAQSLIKSQQRNEIF
jgi:hypothetical protein